MIETILLAMVLAWIFWQLFNFPPIYDLQPAGGGDPFIDTKPKRERKAWEDYLVFKKDSDAPSQDPRIGEAALRNAELGGEWLNFARDAYDRESERQVGLDEMSTRIAEQQLSTQDQANEWAAEDRARYEDKFLPIEDKFIDEASNWGSEANQTKEANKAAAEVQKSADITRQMTERDMARKGIDPRSGRYTGIRSTEDTNTALAVAGAKNMTRDRVKKEGVAMKADAINMGKGLPSQAATAAGLGLSAGGSAMNTQLGAAGNARSNAGMMYQGYGGAINANNSSANILNTQYQNELAAWNANNQANASMWSGVGSMVGSGAALYALSSEDAKENKKPVDGALAAVNGLDVESWDYKNGMGDEGSHVGPYAEDFQRETGLGDGKSINLIDAMGITMKAVQELDEKIEKLAGKSGKKRTPVTIEGEYEVA